MVDFIDSNGYLETWSGKKGYDSVKEHDRFIDTRVYIGAKTKKMQSRMKSFENRIDREIQEKEGLLQDIENLKSKI